MGYVLSERTLGNMVGLHPKLLAVVKRAIQITKQDFGVTAKQVRTAEEQHKLFLDGASQKDGYKNKSNHQVAVDGTGHAVDLTAYVLGQGFDYKNWNLYYPIAEAMAAAARAEGARLTWGGNWYECLNDYCYSATDARAAVERYKAKHPGPDFIDGPHFQLT